MRPIVALISVAFLCLLVGCEASYSGHVKMNTTAGEVRSISVKLPRSGNEVILRDRETVHKLILELEEITKQLRDAEERMPKKEESKE
tara:strand:- start:5189 stop:5452 length:264 start_codon:yes stop_codon:yes gene_type:complete